MTKSKSRDDAAVADDIDRLRQWLDKQPHLPKDIEVAELEAFVRGTKSLEIAKKKLDNYYSVRGRVPQLFDFKQRDPLDPAFQEASKALKMYFLPKPTPEGYRVMMMQIDKDFSSFNHQQKIVRTLMMIELALVLWPEATGVVVCYDLKEAPANLLSKLSVSLSGIGIHWFQSSVPMKMKKGLIINAPQYVNIIVNTIAKPFLSAKLFDRLSVSSDGEETLKKYIPADILPCDYGGQEKSSELLNEQWLEMLVKKRDWFLKTSKQVSDEKKRAPDASNTYGIEGTFRTLTVD